MGGGWNEKRTAVKSYVLGSTMARAGALQRSIEEETTILNRGRLLVSWFAS